MLGVSALIGVRQAYGTRREGGDDVIVLCVSIAGWVLVLLGLASLVTFWLLPIVLVLIGMAVAKFREGERRALLHSLSIAAQRGLPLSDSVRAFAAWRSDEMAVRAMSLADRLDAGMTLPDALRGSRNVLPPDAAMLVKLSMPSMRPDQEEPQIGRDTTSLVSTDRHYAESLQQAARYEQSEDDAWRPIFDRLLYLTIVALFCIVVLMFVMLRIMPTFREIFIDFGVELPGVTQILVSIAHWFANYGILLTPFALAIIIIFFIALGFYSQGKVWIPRPIARVFGKTRTPLALRGLAVCLQQGMTIPAALLHLANAFPDPRLAISLQVAADTASQGGDWCETLCYERAISPTQEAVLQSAMQTNNLIWALLEMANVTESRTLYRAKIALNVFTTLCLLAIALVVGMIAVGCVIPLVSLIQNLT